jgi:hypothetical protein
LHKHLGSELAVQVVRLADAALAGRAPSRAIMIVNAGSTLQESSGSAQPKVLVR